MSKRTKTTSLELPKLSPQDEIHIETNNKTENKEAPIQRNIPEIKNNIETNLKNEEDIKPNMHNSDETTKNMGWQKYSPVIDSEFGICKDYYNTGYCTFGWACKFVHIRDRVALAYDLDRQFEQKQLETSRLESNKPTVEHIDICAICKGTFKNPVQTKCGHVFCQNCAFERFKTDKTCAVCGANTEGIFNTYKPPNSK